MTNKNNGYAARSGELRAVEADAYRLRSETILALAGNAVDYVTSLAKRVAAYIEKRRTVSRIYGELSAMTDRDLADIGLHRCDIPAVADGTYRRVAPAPANVVEIRPAAQAATAEAEYHRAA